MIWEILGLSFLAACFYRLGGLGQRGAEIFPFLPAWLFDTKARDFGVPLCGVGILWSMGVGTPLSLFLFFGLSFASMTTYWDKWGSDDVEWYEWALTGAVYGLAALPVAYFSGLWLGFTLRVIALTIGICLWAQFMTWDDLDEAGRGFLFAVTLPLLGV